MNRIIIWFGYIVISSILYMLAITVNSYLRLEFRYLPAAAISIAGKIAALLYLFYMKDCADQSTVRKIQFFLP